MLQTEFRRASPTQKKRSFLEFVYVKTKPLNSEGSNFNCLK